jgi:ribosomal protein S18
MELLISEDWRKQAGAQPDSSVQPAEEVEKAFLDQAYMHIQNKATPLMKQQFRVGFEVVHKNDENTRMVGVFVFRVGDQFFYAPVFFLNGAIKGTDLLYRANVKRFVPLSNEWCEYLINLSTMDEGHGVSIRERQLTRDQLNLLDVVEPPQMFRYRRKYASADERTKVLAEIEVMLKQAIEVKPQDSKESTVLKKFITGYGGFNAIKKIANTAKHDREFSTALMTGSHPDHYMPQLPPHPPGHKAAAERTPLLVLHTSVLRNQNVKKASVQEMCAGYKLEDFRKEGAVNEVVYTDNQADIHSVEAPGVYSVLMADGSSRKMLVAYYERLEVASIASAPKSYAASYDPPRNRRRSVCLIDAETGKSEDVNMDVNRQEWVFRHLRRFPDGQR